ncbi:hypothetical protein MiSe_57100 [Microseira wollei NIES-4236]|uniref:Dioxygenase n=2 Tax=Microseira wollei TaxID=467598 RepID=A0AAV3XEC4_9CYAN|nr:hypothetical protein MiSe_57100 [Microseira wollei NIES-4236]
MFSVNYGKSFGWFGKLIGLKDFVYLLRWDGQGDLERWKVVLDDGSSVTIEQTMHQIAVTEKYVVLMETAFRFGLEQGMNNPFHDQMQLNQLIRCLLVDRQSPDTTLYIIRRADLKAGSKPKQGEADITVVARKLVLPRESIHIIADWDNTDDRLVLHLGHVCAWEGSEWLRACDRMGTAPERPVPPRLHGMISEETDISYIGRYVIDGETGTLLSDRIIKDLRSTWGIAFFTYGVNPDTGMPPARFDNIYWTCLGLWNELLTEFLVKLTDNYRYRTIPVEDVLLYAEKGVPACLFRVNVGQDEKIAIADCYPFPNGYMVNSPQFIPSGAAEASSTQGYIVCVAFGPDSKEVWIFDGEDLAKGPLCKLSHPSLDFGFTIHTAWLPKIAKRTASYTIPVKADYQALVSRKDRQIRELFDRYVYPHYY